MDKVSERDPKYVRYLECYCNNCRSNFMIVSEKQFPYEGVVCPICQSNKIRFIKIDGE